MQRLTAVLVAAGLIALHSSAFALSKSHSTATAPIAAQAGPASSPDAGAGINLGQGFSLGFDAAYAITSASPGPDARTAGFALSKQSVVQKGDKLSIGISRPLFNAGNDPLSAPALGLTPAGRETDLSIIYSAPIAPKTLGVVSLSARKDVDNLPRQHDVAGMLRIHHSF